MDSKCASSPSPEGAGHGDSLVLIDRLEIFVPRDADVRLVPARDVPRHILKKLGLLSAPRADSSGPTFTWISPVMVREKGSRTGLPISHCSSQAWAGLTAALEACDSTPGSQRARCRLPITCSNLTAFKVLKELLLRGGRGDPDPKLKRALDACQPLRAPLGRALPYCQDAFYVYRGHIFLSINRARNSGSPPPEALPTPAKQTSPRLPEPPASPPHTPAPPSDPPGLAALRQSFGVKGSAQVMVNNLPLATLERLWTAGHVRLEQQAPIGQLHSKVERSGENVAGLWHSGGAQNTPGNTCSEGSSRCSGGRKRRVAHDLGKQKREKGSKEPKPKTARVALHLVSTDVSGDVGIGEGGDVSTGKSGDVSTGEGRDVSTGKGGDVSIGEGGDVGTDVSGDVGTGKSGDVLIGEGGAVSTGEGGDVSTGEGGDVSTGEGGDVSTGEGGDVSIGEGGDVGTGEVWGSEGREVRGGGGAGIQVLDEVCLSPPQLEHKHGFGVEQSAWPALGNVDLPSPSVHFAAGFDFEQSARDEKIHRIRAQLREKEAMLKKLSRS